MSEVGGFRAVLKCPAAVSRLADTLRPERGQPFAMEVEVDQREAGAQPVMVLGDAAVADLVEAEDALEDAEGMFYFRSDSALGRVLPPGFFIDILLIFGPTDGLVMGRMARSP